MNGRRCCCPEPAALWSRPDEYAAASLFLRDHFGAALQQLIGATLHRRRTGTCRRQFFRRVKRLDELFTFIEPSLRGFRFARAHALDLFVQARSGLTERNRIFVVLVGHRERRDMT